MWTCPYNIFVLKDQGRKPSNEEQHTNVLISNFVTKNMLFISDQLQQNISSSCLHRQWVFCRVVEQMFFSLKCLINVHNLANINVVGRSPKH